MNQRLVIAIVGVSAAIITVSSDGSGDSAHRAASPIRKHAFSGSVAADVTADGAIKVSMKNSGGIAASTFDAASPIRKSKMSGSHAADAATKHSEDIVESSIGTASKPNLVMVILDDFGWADVGYHGSNFPTPKQDNLSQQGIRLENYYVMTTCSPTRSALLTGLQPFKLGYQWLVPGLPGWPVHLPYDVPTLGELLRHEGYQTHYIGKWHLGAHEWRATPKCRGFDSFFGYHDGGIDFYDKAEWGSGGWDYWNQTEKAVDKVHTTEYYTKQGEGWANYSEDMYLDYDFRVEIKRVIKLSRDVSKPLFLVYAPMQMHDPLQLPPGGVADTCKTVSVQPAPFCKDQQQPGCYETELKEPCYEGDETCLTATEARQTLCSMGVYLDGSIGILAEELAGVWDNTLMWVTSDNGGHTLEQIKAELPDGSNLYISKGSASSNWPLRGGKTTLFEGGVRGVSWLSGGFIPQEARGTTFRGLLQHVDIPTTLAKLGGAKITGLDGYDVWDAITTTEHDSPRTEIPVQVDTSRLTKTLFSLHLVNKLTTGGDAYLCDSARYGGRGTCEQLVLIKIIENRTWKLISGAQGFEPSDLYFTNDGHDYGDYAAIPVGDDAKAATFTAKRVFRNQRGFGKQHNVYLFDLDNDAREMNNLALTSPVAHEDIINDMLERLWEHYASPKNGYVDPQATIPMILKATATATPSDDGFWTPEGDPEECA